MWPFKKEEPKSEEVIRKEADAKRDEFIQKAARLKRIMLSEYSGWKDYVQMVNEYIESCFQRKRATALDRVTDKELYELKLLDRDISVLRWAIGLPGKFVEGLEKELEDERKDSEGA